MYKFFRSLFFLVKAALLQCRVSLNVTERESKIVDTIKKMRPVSAGRDLIRIGGKEDGSYLVPNDLDGVSACFSPGVSAVATFEEDLAKQYSIQSFLADYSVDTSPVDDDRITFEKKFLGTVNDGQSMRLQDWIERKMGGGGGNKSGELILQMDIEGGEFGVLIDTPSETLRRFRIMIIEFHGMDMMFEKDVLGMIDGIFDKILRDFCVVHIHPNNCSPLFTVGNVAIPRVFEVTFYRRDRAVFDNAKLHFPHRLDRKNVSEKRALILPEIWQN